MHRKMVNVRKPGLILVSLSTFLSLLFLGSEGVAGPGSAGETIPAAEVPEVTRTSVELPEAVGEWTRVSGSDRHDSETIFDYMNGGAEVYLGYRFRHLDVYEYRSPDAGDLLVELFWMGTSDDAYGLLSMDRGGEPVTLAPSQGATSPNPLHPTALFSNGYLRIWSGDLFARLLAYEQTEASKEALLTLGGAICRDRPAKDPPRLMAFLEGMIGSGVELEPDRAVFLRSPLVLNSLSSIDTDGQLGLNSAAAALSISCKESSSESESGPVEMLLVRYATEGEASRALTSYRSAEGFKPHGEAGGFWQEENGWSACARNGIHFLLLRRAAEMSLAESLLESSLDLLAQAEAAAQE
jgi:hypothetical protein